MMRSNVGYQRGQCQTLSYLEANGSAREVPDRITVYQDPICSRCQTEEQVVVAVRRTVIHEVGHHFE